MSHEPVTREQIARLLGGSGSPASPWLGIADKVIALFAPYLQADVELGHAVGEIERLKRHLAEDGAWHADMRAEITTLRAQLAEANEEIAELRAWALPKYKDEKLALEQRIAEAERVIGKLSLIVSDANVVMRAIDGEVRAGRLSTRTPITDARENYSDPSTYPDPPAAVPEREEAERQVETPRVEVRGREDGLWVYLHGSGHEGAVNLSAKLHDAPLYGPIVVMAIEEVRQALLATPKREGGGDGR